MTATEDPLPSWQDGEARTALLDLLARVAEVPPDRRVAVLDNDGTLWTERPSYVQQDFLVAELHRRAGADPGLRDREEYAAVLDGDMAAVEEMGRLRVAGALVELGSGTSPEDYERRVRDFFDTATHPTGRSYRAVVYRPMVELLGALRRAGITPVIVSGGGVEFVRAVSSDLYGIPPWHVLGSTVTYEVADVDGVPTLVRTGSLFGDVNEGDAKVANIRLHLGTRPVLAAGNSAGDARMLDYVQGADGDGLALLVHHDDDEREEAYESVAASFDAEPVLDTAAHRGWTVASMRDDWRHVFGEG